MTLLTKKENRRFINILSVDGTLREKVEEGALGSVRRDYEKTDGTKGTKFELVYAKIEGIIRDVRVYEGDQFRSLHITIENNVGGESDTAILSIPADGSYGDDVMKKLPVVDISLPVSFAPYSFEDDKGKNRRGMTIVQNSKKLQNYYYDFATKKSLHGFPEPEGDTATFKKEDWRIHFMKVRKFLIAETEKWIIAKNFPSASWGEEKPLTEEEKKNRTDIKAEVDSIDPDAIPF